LNLIIHIALFFFVVFGHQMQPKANFQVLTPATTQCFFEEGNIPNNHEGLRIFNGVFSFFYVKKLSENGNGFHLEWLLLKQKESALLDELLKIVKVYFLVPRVHSP
jgi:hypothetical protein